MLDNDIPRKGWLKIELPNLMTPTTCHVWELGTSLAYPGFGSSTFYGAISNIVSG